MSDIETVITDAISEELALGGDALSAARGAVTAIKDARIECVELPERSRQGMVADFPHGVYALPGRVGVYVGEWLFSDMRSCERSPQQIREFAASLLAAADAAEASQ